MIDVNKKSKQKDNMMGTNGRRKIFPL